MIGLVRRGGSVIWNVNISNKFGGKGGKEIMLSNEEGFERILSLTTPL